MFKCLLCYALLGSLVAATNIAWPAIWYAGFHFDKASSYFWAFWIMRNGKWELDQSNTESYDNVWNYDIVPITSRNKIVHIANIGYISDWNMLIGRQYRFNSLNKYHNFMKMYGEYINVDYRKHLPIPSDDEDKVEVPEGSVWMVWFEVDRRNNSPDVLYRWKNRKKREEVIKGNLDDWEDDGDDLEMEYKKGVKKE